MFASRFYLVFSSWLLAVEAVAAPQIPKPPQKPTAVTGTAVTRTAVTRTAVTRTAVTSAAPFRLIVPVMGLDIPVSRGTDNDALRRAPGYDPLSAMPGERGNCVIASHRNVHGAYFWYLTKVQPGATITLQTPQKCFDYRVISAGIVPETRTEVLEPVVAPGASPRLTLYTCTLPVSKNRYVVIAELIPPTATSSTVAPAAVEGAPTSTKTAVPIQRGNSKVTSPGPFWRPAATPEITSGPLRLLKDPALHARYRALLRYARPEVETPKTETPKASPDGGINGGSKR